MSTLSEGAIAKALLPTTGGEMNACSPWEEKPLRSENGDVKWITEEKL